MHRILNITNGDCAVNIMRRANITGTFLPWQDVLHIGPVPENLQLEALSKIRAQFIADCGWGKFADINADFIQRDKQLKTYNQYDKVILWFEHDLYDQLQLIQILDWLQQNPVKNTELCIICTDQYLGRQTPDELSTLLEFEQPITEDHLLLANKAWSAFRSANPEQWADLINDDTSALPFLKGAIIRLLEEYPSTHNGLSRTAHKALEIISKGNYRAEKIFGLYQQTEERVFLGDSSFWLILQEFLQAKMPLISTTDGNQLNLPSTDEQTLTLTPCGKDVLTGKKNWLEITPVNHWIGGVHLNTNNTWLWDKKLKKLCKNDVSN